METLMSHRRPLCIISRSNTMKINYCMLQKLHSYNFQQCQYQISGNVSLTVFVVASCILILLSPFFVQLMHTYYYKIFKYFKSFKIIIVAPTCFGLHKPSSGRSQPALRHSYNVDSCYIYRYMKLYVTGVNVFTLAKYRLRAP